MKNKTLGVLSLGILVLLVFTSLVSAIINIPTNSITFKPYELEKTFTVTTTVDNTVLTYLTSTEISDNQNPANTITLTFSSPVITGTPTTLPGTANLDVGETATITVTSTAPIDDFTLGSFTKSHNITTSDPAISAVLTLNFENTPNKYADNGNLNIDDIDISIEKGFGDDNEWYPMNEIKVSIDVGNDGEEEIKNIVVEWGLYDKQNGKWIVDDEENDFDLDDDKEETLEITFELDEIDEFEDDGDYIFYVWATGDDESTDNKTSTYLSEGIDVVTDNDFVILDDIESAEAVSCGNEIQITADVWNIGDSDQDDVYVVIYNKELGIDEKVTVGDIDAFDSEKLNALVKIPENAEEKSYSLTLSVYDEDDEVYQNDNDDEAEFSYVINVEGECETEELIPIVSVSADLESDSAKAGQEMIVKATISNTGTKKAVLNLELSDYTGWASLVSMDKTSLILEAGASQDVLITLKINKDVSGDKNFNILVKEGEKVLSQPVSVTIEEASVFPGITGLFTGEQSNLYLWGIGALNVLLVFIIIIVAIRVVRKKE